MTAAGNWPGQIIMFVLISGSLFRDPVARISVFQDKAGEHRASIDVTANHILALRQPKRKKQESEPEKTAPDYDNGWN